MTSDPVVGFSFGASGLLSHANPYASAAAFSLQGCSETLTACVYQLVGDNIRGNELDAEKLALLESIELNDDKKSEEKLLAEIK